MTQLLESADSKRPLPERFVPHPDILLYFDCKRLDWRHLPDEGGILDQDLQIWSHFRWIEEAIQIFKARQDAIAKFNQMQAQE